MAVGMSWFEFMRRGDLSSAWTLSDTLLGTRQDHRNTPRHVQRIWDGRSLAGKRVLVRCYHGLGDTIQFIRYIPLVKQIAASVIVWAPSSLLPILATVDGIDQLMPLHDGAFDLAYDVDVEVMELAHVFRTTLDTIPADVPYLEAPGLQRAVSAELRAGFMWTGGNWDVARSIPFNMVACLLDNLGSPAAIHAVPLQLELSTVEAAVFSGQPDVSSIEALAATMASLDLVITVDTMAAHLAGALAVPTWLLLHSDPDWRWMRDRSDTPWYPHTRIYRQSQPGEWSSVLECVRRDLAAVSAGRVVLAGESQ